MPRQLTIETAMEWIDADELVEVTPDAVRVRVWQLRFEGDEPQRGDDCVVLVRGRTDPGRVPTASLADARRAILDGWRPPASEVMC